MNKPSALLAVATIAKALGEDSCRVVFVGGAITGLYNLRDVGEVRPTDDVDCIVGVADLLEYYDFMAAIERRGFQPCADPEAPICRRTYLGLLLDVMPTIATPIGPTNAWYDDALANAGDYVAEGQAVRAITPIYFVATKIEAFKGRGDGDYQSSHDVEDLLAVLGGIDSLRADVTAATDGPGLAIRSQLCAWRGNENFMDALVGHFRGDTAGQVVALAVRTWILSLA